MIDWSNAGGLVDWVTDWLAEWLIELLNNGVIEWLAELQTDLNTVTRSLVIYNKKLFFLRNQKTIVQFSI